MCVRLGPLFDIIEYCDICHHLLYFSQYRIAVRASLSFYFEKKMNTKLLWQPRQRALLFDEVERLSQVDYVM